MNSAPEMTAREQEQVVQPCQAGTRPAGLWALWREDVGCVFARDPAARNRLEVITTYPGVHAIMLHRISHALWRRHWRYSARFIAYLGRMFTNIDIHPGASIGRRFFIDHGAGVVIGETAVIGDDCTLYHGVTLGGTSWNKGRRHPTLGNGVMVGAGAKVLGPIELGDEVRVGANSVVHRNVPAGKTVVGIPGRVVQASRHASDHPYGINLDHHLIPDPVGKAIACLLDRIRELEAQLGQRREDCEEPCPSCEALDVCDSGEDERKREVA